MSGLHQVQCCCSKWETDKNQWGVTNSFGNKTWQGAYYRRPLHASQRHLIDSSVDFNDLRIHLPFPFSPLSPSHENIGKVIVTIKWPQSSFFFFNAVWFIPWLGKWFITLRFKGRTEPRMPQLTLSGLFGTESFGHPLRMGGFLCYYVGAGSRFHAQFSESLKTDGQL